MKGKKDPPDPGDQDDGSLNNLDLDWSSDCGDETTKDQPKPNPPPGPTKFGGKRSTLENYNYTCQDSGPYRVYMELKNEGDQKINKFAVGLMIRKEEEFKNHVTDMKYAGRKRIMVYLSSYAKANRLVEGVNAADTPYRAYVPRHLVSITGVISGIPEDITDQEIIEGIECDVPILSVRRLNRTAERIPTRRVSVTFRSNQLPEYVRLFCCRSTVRPFYQRVVFCVNCLRFNHRDTNCKGRRRCEKCTEQHETNEEFEKCQRNVKCANCNSSDHSSKDEKCPERERQTRIKGLMARRNITYTEAREIIPISSKNLYEPLSHLEEFPVLDNTFADMTGGNYRWKNPLREDWIRTNQERKAIKAAIEIEKEKKEKQKENSSYGKRARKEPEVNNAQKVTEDRNKLVAQGTSNNCGAGLNNTHIVGQTEKWETVLRKAKEQIEAKAQSTIKAAEERHQSQLMNFYADFVTTLGTDEAARSHFNECTKKHFNLARSVIVSKSNQK